MIMSKTQRPAVHAANAADFTEVAYVDLLERAAARYRFVDYSTDAGEGALIWRHDIDYSPHRALALAKLEAARNLRCIYHVLLDSRYYNLFEPEIARIVRAIATLGHEIGLHFDWDVFERPEVVTERQLHERIAFEKLVIETATGVPTSSISFHNYVLNQSRIETADQICGLFNAAAPRIRDRFKYVSDSNGIWRHERLVDLLSGASPTRLHVLTHPEWWTPEPMTPMNRIERVIDGRARANRQIYITMMKRDGRFAAIAEQIGLDPAERSGSAALPKDHG
jgi:hypothetical protein